MDWAAWGMACRQGLPIPVRDRGANCAAVPRGILRAYPAHDLRLGPWPLQSETQCSLQAATPVQNTGYCAVYVGNFFILGGLYPPCHKDLSRTNNMSTEIPRYNPAAIEAKWQQEWERLGLYRTVEDPDRPKWYALTMLPYPSGDLHVGHWYAMTPSDTAARYRRMQGANVFFPIGFDAFGLPAENAAIAHGVNPRIWTYANIDNMRRQLRQMGAMWAWDREAVTCEPGYYKWSQWFFLRLLEADLAYREKAPVDWCPRCNTTLAREQVWGEDKHCERCGNSGHPEGTGAVEVPHHQLCRRAAGGSGNHRVARSGQDHADQLDRPPARVPRWPSIRRTANPIEVFTTRPDTLWAPHSWCWRPSIHWLPRSRPTIDGPRSRLMWRTLRA